jgi:hypothetical protein
MIISELTVEVRDSNYDRVGQILPVDLVGFKAVLRLNNVGSWEIILPDGHEVGAILREPGSGLIVTYQNDVILSGPTVSATNTKTSDNPNGDWKILGVDDSVLLGERLAYPDPSNADVTTQAQSNDTRIAVASTAMYGYVKANIGSLAPAARQISNLVTATDTGLGTTVYPSARFNVLGELLNGIASVDGLGFDIRQVGANLEFSVYQPVDRSGEIRMDVSNNTLSKTEYSYGIHHYSRAIVGGSGSGLGRKFVEVTSTESLSAETLWGRRIETFIDENNTEDTNELEQSGKEKLADSGKTLTSIDITPSSDLTMSYGLDWGLGDKVTVVIGNQEAAAVVTTVSMSVDADGIRVGATVGEATGVDYEGLVAKRTTTTAARVNQLELKEVPSLSWNDTDGTYEFTLKGGDVTLQIGQEQVVRVKNSTGGALSNGTAVYPTGSDGTNKTVAKAQANSESTSSLTFGILTEDIGNGQKGYVTTFGLVRDLDTSALTEGAAVWLSPSTAGGLTSTKPSTPNHIVLIGFCIRSHANNGVIFVNVDDQPAAAPSTTPGDSAPASPTDNQYWWNSQDGTLYFRYNDGSSTQWVQANVGGDAADQTTVGTFNSRLTTVETSDFSQNGRLTTLETNVDTILAQSGYYVRQIFSDVDAVDRSFTTTWVLVYTAPNHTGFLAGSKVRIFIEIPLRNDSTSWGGAYVEPQISFNGGTTWASLGSSGFDGSVMHSGSSDISTYNRMLYIDPQLHGISGAYSVRLRFYCKTYDGSAQWNLSHDLNAVSGTATAITGAGNYQQHYAKVIIEELAVIA